MGTENNTFEKLKDVATFVIAIITCIAGVIFWVQSANDDKISHLEHEISEIRSDVKDLEKNTSEILRVVGRLEGRMGRTGNRN